ncbi:MAG: hypothetical protein ACTXOO_03240 [Sodalis sp. (in: enterobacteria)]
MEEGERKYIITLTSEEGTQLKALAIKGEHVAQKVISGLILFKYGKSIRRVKQQNSQALAGVSQISQIDVRKIN